MAVDGMIVDGRSNLGSFDNLIKILNDKFLRRGFMNIEGEEVVVMNIKHGLGMETRRALEVDFLGKDFSGSMVIEKSQMRKALLELERLTDEIINDKGLLVKGS